MDSRVTVRYFKLTNVARQPVRFETAIFEALGLGASPSDRQRQLALGVTLRLEGAYRRNGLVVGEVVRVQTENIPPEAQPAGLVPLGIGGLGHSIGFAYDRVSGVIAIQFDPRGVSLGRFLDYLRNVQHRADYSYSAVVSNDAWERYNRGQPRTLTVTIAAPENLDNVPGPANSVIQASKRLADISEAPVITIDVSMGHTRRRNLSRDFVSGVLDALTGDGAADSIRSLKVKSKQEGLPSDEIDFVNDFARDQETLELPAGDHDENIARRLRYIQRCLINRLPDLRALYGE